MHAPACGAARRLRYAGCADGLVPRRRVTVPAGHHPGEPNGRPSPIVPSTAGLWTDIWQRAGGQRRSGSASTDACRRRRSAGRTSASGTVAPRPPPGCQPAPAGAFTDARGVC